MKSEKEILDKLKEINLDKRLHYKAADVFTNAPLALIQTSLEAQVSLLKWILELDK